MMISANRQVSVTMAMLVLTALSETIHGGVLTDRDILYTDIFTNYSAKTLPVLNHTHKVLVKFNAFISNINNFNELSGELSITLSLFPEWKEERISWDPAVYNGITSISVLPTDLWRPQMFLLESSDSVKDLGNTSIQPKLYANGDVFWNSANVLKIACSVNVEFFPYDEQRCEMTILSWDVYSSDVIYVPNNTAILQTYFKSNSQWKLVSGGIKNCSYIPSPCLSLFVVLQRRSGFYVIYILVPLIFLSLINNLVFLMPPSSGERTSVAVTAFLSFVVYMDITNDLVPQSSDPVAYIYYYIIFLMVYSCCIMFLCIISLRIYNRQTDVPRWLQTMIRIMRFECLREQTGKVGDSVKRAKRSNSYTEGVVDEIIDISKTDLRTEDEYGRHDGDMKSTKRDQMNRKDTVITWHNVGRVYDKYCCVILYVFVVAFTTATFIKLSWSGGVTA